MPSQNLLLPLNDGVPQTVNTATGAPLPTSLTGLTSDPYRGARIRHPEEQELQAVHDHDKHRWRGRRLDTLRSTFEALPFVFAVSPMQCHAALKALGGPQELAPGYGLPKAVAGWCFGQRAAHRFSSTPVADRNRAYQLAEQAHGLAPHDALTLSSGALVLLPRLEEADRRLERALALDPWLAYAWIRGGWMSAYLGDADGAIRELIVALERMPFEPLRHISFIGMGCAYFAAERHERAAQWIRSAVEAYPGSFRRKELAVAAVALTGAKAEACRMARKLMRKDPDLTISEARLAWPFTPGLHVSLGRRPGDRRAATSIGADRLCSGLLTARPAGSAASPRRSSSPRADSRSPAPRRRRPARTAPQGRSKPACRRTP
jgi:tetratricopeptide (TPR) repeat protein